jgi:hypothetical protein
MHTTSLRQNMMEELNTKRRNSANFRCYGRDKNQKKIMGIPVCAVLCSGFDLRTIRKKVKSYSHLESYPLPFQFS